MEGKKERDESKDVGQRSSEIEGKVELSKSQKGKPIGHGLAIFDANGHAEQSEDVDDA